MLVELVDIDAFSFACTKTHKKALSNFSGAMEEEEEDDRADVNADAADPFIILSIGENHSW